MGKNGEWWRETEEKRNNKRTVEKRKSRYSRERVDTQRKRDTRKVKGWERGKGEREENKIWKERKVKDGKLK